MLWHIITVQPNRHQTGTDSGSGMFDGGRRCEWLLPALERAFDDFGRNGTRLYTWASTHHDSCDCAVHRNWTIFQDSFSELGLQQIPHSPGLPRSRRSYQRLFLCNGSNQLCVWPHTGQISSLFDRCPTSLMLYWLRLRDRTTQPTKSCHHLWTRWFRSQYYAHCKALQPDRVEE